MNEFYNISTVKLEGHIHSTKISFFAINLDDVHKFRLKYARTTECMYACEWVSASVYGLAFVYKDRGL